MIRFAVRFAVAAFLSNAAYHLGSEYLAHLHFRDAVRDLTLSASKSDAELKRAVMTIASQHAVPLSENHLAVRRRGGQVRVQGFYEKPIRVLPLYGYPWRFELLVDTPLAEKL